jgi:hypothetical protein
MPGLLAAQWERMVVRFLCAALLGCALFASAEPGWHQVPFSYQVNAVAVRDNREAWAAGSVASYLSGFLRWNGADWTLVDTFRRQLVYDICYAGDRAWAVGEQFNFPDGVVYRWDGAHWQQQPDPFDRTLQAVAFPDSVHGYAAGAAPVTQHPVMRYADGFWRLDTGLTTRRIVLGLFSPWFGKCYAVGDSGAIFRYDYGVWTQVRSPTTQVLRRVALESNTEGWAVGNRGTILRCFKDTWALVPSPTTRNLFGLAIAGTSGEAWAVGDSGTILHCVRDSWHLEPFVPSPPDVPLYTVSFSSGTDGWAFGYRTMGASAALRYYDPAAVVERPSPRVGNDEPELRIVRGVLNLPAATGRKSQAAGLLDATGRKVLDLYPGPNDVSRFAAGMFFIYEQPQAAGRRLQAVRRVVIHR